MEPPFDAWLAPLLQCNDSAYPVGAFAHSFGLEGMVQTGAVTDRVSLLAFLHGPVRHGLAKVDLPLLAHAYEAAKGENVGELVRLDHLSAACRAPSELREAATRVGRQRLEMLDSVWAQHLKVPELDLPHKQAPIVAGIEARVLGAPKRSAMLAYAHGSYAAILSAAIKLLRLGQTAVQQMLMKCSRTLGVLIQTAEQTSLDDVGSFAPLLDTSSMRHERCAARLFLS
jgi:urease accessory protein